MSKSTDLFKKRVNWVNSEYDKEVGDRMISQKEKLKIKRSLWKQAKKEITK